MDWISFTLGLLGGFIATVILIVALLLVYARPFFQVAKKQRETQDKIIKDWVEQMAKRRRGSDKGSMRRTPMNKQRRIRDQLVLCENALMTLEERIHVADQDAAQPLLRKQDALQVHINSLQRWLTFCKAGGKARRDR